MRTRIVSFHNGNLNSELLQMQKAVFDKFNIPLEQIQTDLPHPEAIDNFFATEEWDIIVLFDADCIPLDKGVVNDAVNIALRFGYIISVAQKASHIPESKVYASPAFMVLSKETFIKIGAPSFKATERGDVAEEISYAARAAGIQILLMLPTQVEVPLWPLADGVMFGYGTTYNGYIYHAFESNANHGSTARFIEKCKSIIDQ